MKNRLFTILFLCCTGIPMTLAQMTAGSTPNGMCIINPLINLSVDVVFEEDTASFDIDGDGVNDLRIRLYKGATIVDGASSVVMYQLNSSVEICSDTGFFAMANYYNLDDTLSCAITDEWNMNFPSPLGNYGCFLCFGPSLITDSYIAFRLDSVITWIKISFDIDDSEAELTASISEVLTVCTVNSIGKMKHKGEFNVFPNPVSDRMISIECAESVLSVEVFNMMGQRVTIPAIADNQIELPESKGMYMVKVYGENGGYWQRKVLRQR